MVNFNYIILERKLIMKRLSGFIAGVLFTLVLSFIFVPSLAANLQTIEVGINSVNIVVDGKKISSIGEGYLRQGTEGEIAASLNMNQAYTCRFVEFLKY
jgi:hypothetical protein